MPLISTDLEWTIQVVSESGEEPLSRGHEQLKKLRPHTPVVVHGVVKSRNEGRGAHSVNAVTSREIHLSAITALNTVGSDVVLKDETNFGLEQRHLQIRTDSQLRRRLYQRSAIARVCRAFLEKQNFLEVETPLLFKSSAEGAREFLVPTRTRGLAYALPQSPQQYKQLLIAAGVPRYYQLARCFRDEDLRADRQPEFTQVSRRLLMWDSYALAHMLTPQLDLEMAFATQETVMPLVEQLLHRLWREVLDIDLPTFTRMTYDEAMARYGSDKPDVRVGMEVSEHPLIAVTRLTCLD